MPIKVKGNVKKEFNELVENLETSETDLQTFFENNPEMLPILNTHGHGLHLSSIILKLPLGTKYKTDFVYLNKDSAEWRVCLIEIEKSSKVIFKKNGGFTSDFNQAYEQIESWENWLKQPESKIIIKKSLKNMMVPLGMSDNPISFHYILVIGKKSADWTKEQEALWNNRNKDNLKIFTYDQILRYKENDQRFDSDEIHVIRINDEDKITFDRLIVNRFFKDLEILNPKTLIFTKEQSNNLESKFDKRFINYLNRGF